MKFGTFVAPFHRVGDDPTVALQRDLELIEHLDRLGYDEAWIGEHHSAGVEIIGSPEVFIAAAAERTRRIRLGTGVSSLPYHHPLLLADRMVMLSHLTLGRAMLGCGPGSLPSDAMMMAIEPNRQREMMEEALEDILQLLAGQVVTSERDWYTLNDARLQLLPYRGSLEVAVAAMVSPAGPRTAGRFGCGLLSLGATSVEGFKVLARHWQVMEERAMEFGVTVDRRAWRVVGPMHIAESEAQARKDVAFGLREWMDYFQNVAALPMAVDADLDDVDSIIDGLIATGLCVIGTPDQAAVQIERLYQQTGGFGTYLFLGHEWANRQATLTSYELFARYVAPRFTGAAAAAGASRDWAAANREAFIGGSIKAVLKAIDDHVAERDAKQPVR